MAVFTLDWSETNLGGSAVVSYGAGAVLDFTDKPAGATAALSLTAHHGDSTNITLAEFSIETSGSSVMTFDYHTSTESGWDKLHIDVDGVSQANYSGTTAWTSHPGINIASAGVHTIRFRYQKDAGSSINADRVWVALLNITNTVAANDASGTVTTYDMEDGSIPGVVTTSTWTNSTSSPIAGTRSLRSPASPAANGSYDLTIAKAAGSGYATVGFAYKTDSESGYDRLFVFPDATASNVPASGAPSADGASGWIDYSGSTSGRLAVILPAAAGTVLLRYTKDGGGDVGADAAWIDTLSMPAGGGATNYNGTATRASTVTTTSTGVVGKVATAALAATVAIAATGVVARSTTTTRASTGTISATGVVGKSATTGVASTGTITSTGSVTSGTNATSTIGSTGAVTSTGVVGRLATSAVAGTGAIAATGVVGKTASSTITGTSAVTSTGTVVSGLSASSTVGATAATAASGVVGRAATSSVSSTGTISATGLVEVPGSGTATLASTGTITTAGQVAATSLASVTAAAQMLATGAVGVTSTTTLAATATVTAAGVVIDPGAISPTPADRTIVVAAETRTLVVPAESRATTIPAENRTLEA